MEFRNLAAFARYIVDRPLSSLAPPLEPMRTYTTPGGVVQGVCLYRNGPWQVELFSVQPNGAFPPHRHPNVDSIEVHLSGDLRLTVRGKLAKRITRIRPRDWHGGTSGPGGTFLSVQRWLNDVAPTSVGLDWEGPPHVDVSEGVGDGR